MHIAAVLSFLVVPLVSFCNALHDAPGFQSSFELTPLLNPLTNRHNSNHGHAHRKVIKALQARATPPPLGWTPSGCFSDSTEKRALAAYSTNSNSNTPNSCMAICQGKGYVFAGVEYGKQCFCANKITVSASPSSGQKVAAGDCSMPCTGDPTQKCGAGKRISIFSFTQPFPSGWSVLGCYTDTTTNRALKGYSATSSTNTPASCTVTCASKGYLFAGVEFGSECYCSNTITITPSVGQFAAASQCSMACSGNAAEKCGGSGRITIFTSSWSHLGCYSDGPTRALQGLSITSPSNSPTFCTTKCAAGGYMYAGVEYGSECYCSNKITVNGDVGTVKPQSDCSMACSGDATKECGAGYRLDVYSSTVTTPPGWSRLGCFTDSISARALQGGFYTSIPTNSQASCMSTCANLGYNLAGVEYGVECFCSNTITTNSTGQLTVDGDCNMPCSGDTSSTCGAGDRIEIFADAAWNTSAISPWNIAQTYQGDTFFDGWNFINVSDYTHGVVDYQSYNDSLANGLISINDAGNAIMSVETTPVVPGNRKSVRIESINTFTGGILIGDFVHVPTGCGTWPAFWTCGPNWPAGGEIDIVEGVHVATQNLMSIHTAPNCTMPKNFNGTGTLIASTNCDAIATGSAGCAIQSNVPNFGAALNVNGGGVFAMVWEPVGIAVYFWPRGSIPVDIALGAPRPDLWPLPSARWPSSTCSPDHFIEHVAILDTTLCGDWAGNVWTATNFEGQVSSCQTLTGYSTCAAYVQANGTAFEEAYWEIRSVKLYQQ